MGLYVTHSMEQPHSAGSPPPPQVSIDIGPPSLHQHNVVYLHPQPCALHPHDLHSSTDSVLCTMMEAGVLTTAANAQQPAQHELTCYATPTGGPSNVRVDCSGSAKGLQNGQQPLAWAGNAGNTHLIAIDEVTTIQWVRGECFHSVPCSLPLNFYFPADPPPGPSPCQEDLPLPPHSPAPHIPLPAFPVCCCFPPARIFPCPPHSPACIPLPAAVFPLPGSPLPPTFPCLLLLPTLTLPDPLRCPPPSSCLQVIPGPLAWSALG